MGRRGPKPTHPHTLEVAFTDEEWAYIGVLSTIAGGTKPAPRSAVVRALVAKGLAPLKGTPLPEQFRPALDEPVVGFTTEEAISR